MNEREIKKKIYRIMRPLIKKDLKLDSITDSQLDREYS
jgi:hypothetical protein